MDITDKKILSILDENARLPSSLIAKKLKTSRQVVEYRIDKLQKEGIILNFTALIDPTKFYDNIWHIYLKLQNLTTQSEQQILDYLNKKKEVWWIAKCQGEWDLIFSVVGNDITEFDNVLTNFKSLFHKYINQQYTTSLIKVFLFQRAYFLNKQTKKQVYIGERKHTKIDKRDLDILKHLTTDARMPATQIAQKTKLSARQVIYRIRELEKKEIIRAYKLHLNCNKFNYDYYKVFFYTQDFTEQQEKSLLSWCETNSNVL